MASIYVLRRWYPCGRCGEPTNRKRRDNGSMQCMACGIQRMADNIRQLNGKSGPEYEKWRDAVLAAILTGG